VPAEDIWSLAIMDQVSLTWTPTTLPPTRVCLMVLLTFWHCSTAAIWGTRA